MISIECQGGYMEMQKIGVFLKRVGENELGWEGLFLKGR